MLFEQIEQDIVRPERPEGVIGPGDDLEPYVRVAKHRVELRPELPLEVVEPALSFEKANSSLQPRASGRRSNSRSRSSGVAAVGWRRARKRVRSHPAHTTIDRFGARSIVATPAFPVSRRCQRPRLNGERRTYRSRSAVVSGVQKSVCGLTSTTPAITGSTSAAWRPVYAPEQRPTVTKVFAP